LAFFFAARKFFCLLFWTINPPVNCLNARRK
jgi:hypothetical protein